MENTILCLHLCCRLAWSSAACNCALIFSQKKGQRCCHLAHLHAGAHTVYEQKYDLKKEEQEEREKKEKKCTPINNVMEVTLSSDL